jgi:hypothetical protein
MFLIIKRGTAPFREDNGGTKGLCSKWKRQKELQNIL